MALEDLIEPLIGGTLALLVSAVAALIVAITAIIQLTAAILGFIADKIRSWLFPTEQEKLERKKRLGFYEGIYYWLHPDKLRKRREREKREKEKKEEDDTGKLLVEYENLLLRREELEDEIDSAESALRDFARFISRATGRDAFVKRAQGEGAKRSFEAYNPKRRRTYEEIEEMATELERVAFRIFAIKQELKLYGIDKGEDNG